VVPVPTSGEATAAVAARVATARARARDRGVRANAELTSAQLAQVAPPTPEARRRIDRAVQAGRLTGRGAEAVLRVALTIADLQGDNEPQVRGVHITAALALRAALPPATIH
jgi:magnesium chelatase family protein